ncbi:sigma-54 dependent transcriptional regulator [Flavitalea sp. BT771]|uniref:sigma-54-dependent transcriptional regulator n=1 Tax=Flavitalea sp. BT771 TaxID=3063329 RepID=UPI0026E424DA|nr:sigma-54 dependent transcriptional regulator [Flavitalea sp. BT771]MDO6430015.1 sigma-54 dependent transcriptional regulator [Flavitalea sp. BT771]MDV6217858.1 sigma-54 dependent transcriptional regulator [Flavitalea sp. BT771]
MKKKILIVEDGIVEANNLRIIMESAGYVVSGLVDSYERAIANLDKERPDLVLLDIFLAGPKTGIDLARVLKERNIAFIYLSANSNKDTLELAKVTGPYGFLVKPFRKKDILIALEIANYLHEQKQTIRDRETFLATFEKPSTFPGIIGNSPELLKIFHLVKVVAPTDTSVLILGESGTGKEGIAENIHAASSRKSKPLIKVNCAALPASLIESELFGHEKAAFTGAYDQRIGKFEQANKGTVFLDEIGDMPIDLQVKLLRVLQEKEIDRIGGKGSIKVDIRIIAATNRDLEKEVMEGRFRMDLYYRLNVFPILMPPLRDRKTDIPALAGYFIERFCKHNNLGVKTVSREAMDSLLSYPWPGNIRELQYLMERTVLLTPGDTIHEFTLPNTAAVAVAAKATTTPGVKTIREMEIDHIKAVLDLCKGKIYGPGGAAEMLKIPYSTLISRIKKLGIKIEKSYR